MPWFSILIKIGAIAGLTTVILVLLYGQSRVFFTMSHDGLLPKVFSSVHPRLRTPWLSQALIGSIVAVIAALVPINILGELVSIGTLFAFILVCGAVIYLRKSERTLIRPFKVPGVPVVPILGIGLLPAADGRPAARHLDPPRRLAGHRLRHLFRLWPHPFGPAQGGVMTLRIDADFDCGNIEVHTVSETSADLTIRKDSNGRVRNGSISASAAGRAGR